MIILDRQRTDEADEAAIRRMALALKQGRVQRRGLENASVLEMLFYDCLGTRAEIAAHLLFRQPWTPYSEEAVQDGDLCGFIEVKGVARPKDRLLIKRERAKRDHAYLLMDGTFHPAWFPVGWIWGDDAMIDKYLDSFGDQPPCWIVPRSQPPLRPVRELYDLAMERMRVK